MALGTIPSAFRAPIAIFANTCELEVPPYALPVPLCSHLDRRAKQIGSSSASFLGSGSFACCQHQPRSRAGCDHGSGFASFAFTDVPTSLSSASEIFPTGTRRRKDPPPPPPATVRPRWVAVSTSRTLRYQPPTDQLPSSDVLDGHEHLHLFEISLPARPVDQVPTLLVRLASATTEPVTSFMGTLRRVLLYNRACLIMPYSTWFF